MKITISGQAATGTSSVGKLLAKTLDYQFISAGQLARNLAEEKGVDLNRLEVMMQENPEFDKQRDLLVKKFAENHDDFVCDGSLAWFFIPDAFKVKLTCDFETRITRVARREGLSTIDARERTLQREEVRDERWKRFYNLNDCLPDKVFDLIIDSAMNSVEEIVDKIISTTEKQQNF